MPSRKNQVFIGFKCDPEFRALVESAAKGDLSKFVRTALVEKLNDMHIKVNPALAEAPSRLGKGGPKKRLIALRQEMDGMEQSLRVAENGEASLAPLEPMKPMKSITYEPKRKKKGPP